MTSWWPRLPERVIKRCTPESDLNRLPRGLFEERGNSKGVEYFVRTLVVPPTCLSASNWSSVVFRVGYAVQYVMLGGTVVSLGVQCQILGYQPVVN